MVNFAWIMLGAVIAFTLMFLYLNRHIKASIYAEDTKKSTEKEGRSTRTRSRTPRVSPVN